MNAAVEGVNQLASRRAKVIVFDCYVDLPRSILQRDVANHKKVILAVISQHV